MHNESILCRGCWRDPHRARGPLLAWLLVGLLGCSASQQSSIASDDAPAVEPSVEIWRTNFTAGFWDHTYQFKLTELSDVEATLTEIPWDIDVDLYLDRLTSNRAPEQIAYSEAELGVSREAIKARLPEGTYQWRVLNKTERPFDAGKQYEIRYTTDPMGAYARAELDSTDLTNGQMLTGLLNGDDMRHVYLISLPQSIGLSFGVSSDDITQLQVHLYRQDGTEVSQTSPGGKVVQAPIWTPGDYVLVIEQNRNQLEVNYTLAPSAYPLTTETIKPNDDIYRVFDTRQAFHVYRYYHSTGSGIEIALRQIPTQADYDLRFFNDQGQLVIQSNAPHNDDELIRLSNLPKGQYYLMVIDINQMPRKDPYLLQLWLSDSIVG